MNGDGFLHRYFLNNQNKRLHKWLHYFDIYERHFERFRSKNPVMIEIGVARGGSVAMWREYFGTGCKIVGIDFDKECKQHEAQDIEIFIGSQDSDTLIAEILAKYPHIDIVLDDGSHFSRHMIKSFDLLYKKLSPTGVYMIEDTHANYWEKWEGGLRRPDTFIEFSKNKIDELNAVHTEGAVPRTNFTDTTDSITFYDSIIVFEKRPQSTRQAFVTRGINVS